MYFYVHHCQWISGLYRGLKNAVMAIFNSYSYCILFDNLKFYEANSQGLIFRRAQYLLFPFRYWKGSGHIFTTAQHPAFSIFRGFWNYWTLNTFKSIHNVLWTFENLVQNRDAKHVEESFTSPMTDASEDCIRERQKRKGFQYYTGTKRRTHYVNM